MAEHETKTEKAKRKLKPPATLGDCIDRLYTLREEKLEYAHKAEDAQAQFTALQEHVLKKYKRSGLEGARGAKATVSITHKTVGRIEDREKLQAFVKKLGAWDLLTYQVNNKAYRGRLEEKKTVPGVVPLEITSLSVTKAARKK